MYDDKRAGQSAGPLVVPHDRETRWHELPNNRR